MSYRLVVTLSPKEAFSSDLLENIILAKSGINNGKVEILKRSIDARKLPVKVRIEANVYEKEDGFKPSSYTKSDNDVTQAIALLNDPAKYKSILDSN